MPFAIKTLMEQRLELLRLALQPQANISELAKRYGISRKTCYKWIKRFQQDQQDLSNHSCRPLSSPMQTPAAIEEKIIAYRKAHPYWGARKIRALLHREQLDRVPAQSTINAILLRHQLIDPEKSQQHTPPQRFCYEQPNILWQMDFKGQFPLLDRSLCYPLTILDDHSRFNLCLCACANEKALTVRQRLTAVFRRYGMPQMILADNGAPWGVAGHSSAQAEVCLSSVEVWLLRLQVQVIHGRAYHPQTQGKEERFHRTLKTELLQYEQYRDMVHCQQGFDRWRDQYNLYRPHAALDFKTPGQCYSSSSRSFPEHLPAIEYGDSDVVRRVGSNGCISYKGKTLRVGKGLADEPVALRETGIENSYDIYYCNQKIKRIFIDA